MKFLSVESLSFSYGRREIFHKTSFHLEKGERTVLIGRNGSGKSTLFSLIAGLLRPSEGRILLEGTELSEKERTRKISMVVQNPAFFEELSVDNHIQLWYNHFKYCDNSFLMDLTDRLGLKALLRKRVSILSGGERKRLALLLGLISRPALLLLDEPFAALDPPGREEFLSVLSFIEEEGVQIILSVHEWMGLRDADRLLTVEGGSVREEICSHALSYPEFLDRYCPKKGESYE